MDGIRIFIHALRMVLGNFGAALRVGGLALVALVGLVLSSGSMQFASPIPGGDASAMPQFSGTEVLFTALQLVAALWAAVAWHRYILLEEQPGPLAPAWKGSAIWSYFKTGLILALVLIPVAIVISMIGAFLVFPTLGGPDSLSGGGGFLVIMIVYLPMSYFGYRLSPVLPSAAIGRELGLKEAWQSTRSGGFSFVALAILSVAANWVAHFPSTLLSNVALVPALVLAAAAHWLSILVGASILTTIYGHYIEKRPLNA